MYVEHLSNWLKWIAEMMEEKLGLDVKKLHANHFLWSLHELSRFDGNHVSLHVLSL